MPVHFCFLICFFILYVSISDKNQHLNEFINQIKTSPDLAPIFDSIQKDSNSSINECFPMDQS